MEQSRIESHLVATAREFWQIFRDIYDPYRPELHYMRGPGPKWHAVHAPVANRGSFSNTKTVRG